MAGWGNVPTALRAAGAAKAMGTPKVKTAAPSKSVRMPQQHAKAPPRLPASAHAHSGSQHGAAPQRAFYELGPGGIHHLATKQVQQETQSNLAPYRQKAAEITGTEQTVAKRFGGYGEATDRLLGGLQTGAEGAAKTYGNMAADAALKASGSVSAVGQQSQQANAGYLDPQVANALKEQQANITGIGASRQAGAETLGQSEQGFLTNMRAAAAQRATEGQQGIASTFGKQLAANQQGQNAVLARQPGAISKLTAEYEQKAFTNKATEQGLGIKVQGLRQKGRETRARVGATERGQNLTREAARERAGASREASIRSAQTAEKDTTARIEAAIAKGTLGGKTLTPNEKNALSGEFGRAYEGFRIGRSGNGKLTPGEIRENLTLGKEGKRSFPKATNSVLITAAQELFYTHKVSKATRAAMGKLGMNIGTDEEAFHAISGH